MMYELPPQSQGTAEEQLAALRDYLVRLARELDQTEKSETQIVQVAGKVTKKAQEKTAEDIRAQSAALKALIIKNANEVIAYADSKVEEYDSKYVAQSDFGNYYQSIETQVETTARGTVESYHYTDAIEALDTYMTELNGQIRRGVMEDPVTHDLHLGIAISESLEFTGQEVVQDGVTYYELASGQTLGLYTSTGWQFWINGILRGYFSSEDSMLHVSNIVVEDTLNLGGSWEITTTGGFGLRYAGG